MWSILGNHTTFYLDRLHHKCSETQADPHNANRGFFFSHMGWLMVRWERGSRVMSIML